VGPFAQTVHIPSGAFASDATRPSPKPLVLCVSPMNPRDVMPAKAGIHDGEAHADVVVGDDGGAGLGEVSLPPVWSPWKWVLTRYLMGSGEIALIAALIFSESGANWPSTMRMPSEPTATVMLPPRPSSI
jgi:hypothetical protein